MESLSKPQDQYSTIDELIDGCNRYYGDAFALSSELSGYSCVILYKSKFIEDDIFPVYYKKTDSKKRLGWLFPVATISSDQHRYSNDVHYPFYAKIACNYLFASGERAFHLNSHILVCKDEQLLSNLLMIENLIIPLIFFGYHASSFPDVYHSEFARIPDKTVELIIPKSGHHVIEYKPYIVKLIKEYIPGRSDPLVRFVQLYQCIELMMEAHFMSKVNEIQLKKATIGGVRKKIGELSSEHQLLTSVFHSYSISNQSTQEEIEIAKIIFGEEWEVCKQKLDLIYNLRNSLLHSFHKLDMLDDLSKVVDCFERMIMDLLLNERLAEDLFLKG